MYMQDIEERVMMIRDAVLTPDCQLYYDYLGPHDKNLYGERRAEAPDPAVNQASR